LNTVLISGRSAARLMNGAATPPTDETTVAEVPARI